MSEFAGGLEPDEDETLPMPTSPRPPWVWLYGVKIQITPGIAVLKPLPLFTSN